MEIYKDDYNCLIIDQDYPEDCYRMKFPFVRPRDCFVVPSDSGKFETKYIRLNMSLDIETTTIEGKSAPYIMTLSLNVPHEDIFYTYHCRSWAAVQSFMDDVAVRYGVGQKRWSKDEKKYINYDKWHKGRRVLLCYIHNASYEFAFCRQELKFARGEYDFFSKNSRKMMKANLENGIEFRDSMALSNSSLIQLSHDFTRHKKIKDLDYRKARNTKTKISRNERRYINDDVIILNEYEDKIFDEFCRPNKKVPLTNTARLLLRLEEEIGPQIEEVRKAVAKMQPDAKTIMEASRHLFRGGFVHGNIRYLNAEVYVKMRDITSSYPYIMLTQPMPMGKFVEKPLEHNCYRKGHESRLFRDLCRDYCVIIDATYYNLKAITDHSYESLSKVVEFVGDPAIKSCDNGRIRKADSVRVVHTQHDFTIYNWMYHWDVMEIHHLYFARKGPLPEWLQKCICRDYIKKNQLKVAGKDGTPEYALSKVDVNTYFGAACKSVYDQNIGYDYESGEWIPKAVDLEDIQKDIDKRFMNFYWGVFICAAARLKLVRMMQLIEQSGGSVVYYDTDSLKYVPSPDGKTEEAFEAENRRIAEERKRFPLLQDENFWTPPGQPLGKGLGEWDDELKGYSGSIVKEHPGCVPFKTLGAKRYLYFDPNKNKHKLCVAGLPKVASSILEERGDPFEIFCINGFSFTGEETDKLRPDYIDTPYDVTIDDGEGNVETIHCKTGVTLVPVSFEITEKKMFSIIQQNMEFINQRRRYLHA